MTTLNPENSGDGGLPHAAHLDAAVESDEGDLLLRVTGIVPAEEFHPFVIRLARRLRLRGWIRHDPSGALIRVLGDEVRLAQLVRALWTDAPPSARIRSLDPEAFAVDTPGVGDKFVALVEEPVEWHDPTPTGPLAHVA